MHACTCGHVFAYAHACMCTSVQLCAPLCMHICVQTCVHVRVRTCPCLPAVGSSRSTSAARPHPPAGFPSTVTPVGTGSPEQLGPLRHLAGLSWMPPSLSHPLCPRPAPSRLPGREGSVWLQRFAPTRLCPALPAALPRGRWVHAPFPAAVSTGGRAPLYPATCFIVYTPLPLTERPGPCSRRRWDGSVSLSP